MTQSTALIQGAFDAWSEADTAQKCLLVAALAEDARTHAQQGDQGTDSTLDKDAPLQDGAVQVDRLDPGRPERPITVHPTKVARRGRGRASGRGVMIHAIAHIEFNAMNLALDAVWRYPNMPASFAKDWIKVAADEARHFQILSEELDREGHAYGDFDAHDGLWDMARKTAHDLLARMALVPRVLEARGLDATPVIQLKLRKSGDEAGANLLQVLLDEEVEHVRIGDYWFRRLAAQRGEEAESAYRRLLGEFDAPLPKPPMNREARLAAGFSEAELVWLEQASQRKHQKPA